jgi:hypothetical protein
LVVTIVSHTMASEQGYWTDCLKNLRTVVWMYLLQNSDVANVTVLRTEAFQRWVCHETPSLLVGLKTLPKNASSQFASLFYSVMGGHSVHRLLSFCLWSCEDARRKPI